MSEEAAARAGPLRFQEAIDYFVQKVNLPTRAWTDLREGQHARAFVIAGATKSELLVDMRAALQKALDEGTTLATFRKDFDAIVARHGWSYKGGRGWRTRVIYDTNMRMARAAGQWAQIDRAAERERSRGRTLYLRYGAVLDARTRQAHRDWHGVVLPVDHDWWQTHYPPNGWRCRCTIMALTERDLRRYNYTVTPDDEVPPVQMEDRTVRLADGSTATWPTPAGIDTGFGYHVGHAAHGQSVDRRVMEAAPQASAPTAAPEAVTAAAPAAAAAATRRTKLWEPIGGQSWQDLGLPEALPLDDWAGELGAPAADRNEMLARLMDVLGGAERTVMAPDGEAVHLTAQVLADHLKPDRAPFVPMLPAVLEAPAEIWLSWERHTETERVAVRKRYLRVLRTSEKSRGVLVVAQSVGGRFEGWTFMPVRRPGYLNNQRHGTLLYRRGEDDEDEGEE